MTDQPTGLSTGQHTVLIDGVHNCGRPVPDECRHRHGTRLGTRNPILEILYLRRAGVGMVYVQDTEYIHPCMHSFAYADIRPRVSVSWDLDPNTDHMCHRHLFPGRAEGDRGAEGARGRASVVSRGA